MQFDVLGPLRVVGADGNQQALTSASQRRLLSLLIMRAGSVVAADVLEEHLELSGGALRTAVSRLRRIVGPENLVTAPPGYELRTDNIDAIQFERLLASRTRRDLGDALALWRGDAYAEFADEAWAMPETRRLATLRAGAVEDLVELMLGAEDWTAAIAMLEPFVETEPYRDRPRGLLMRALAGCGRRTDALRAFQTYRRFLADEVGTEPSAALVTLDREIAAGDQTIDVHAAPFDAPGVFLMSDIVGSTQLWLASPEAMGADLIVHDAILRRAIAEHSGVVIATAGDSFTAAFEVVVDACAAAIATQRALAATKWESPTGLKARIAVHLGIAQRRGNGWFGAPLNETARIMAVGHGGQIVVSEPVAAQLADMDLVDLGEHRLRDLVGVRRLYQVTAAELPREFPSLRSLGRYVTTLPAQRTALFGRETLLSEVRGRLIDHALVSLIGPGGVGKTRAAVEAAGRDLAGFEDGVFFIDLTTAADNDDVVAAFVSGVKASVPPDRPADDALAEHLAERHALLVVDNCEHVIDHAAVVIDNLLDRARIVRVLATSREALRIRGEQCVSVPPLDVDGPDSPGVRLFIERADAAGCGDAIGADDIPTLVEIAQRLDGIPLAIELAAAQLGPLTPAQILEHLDDRFRVLNRGYRTAPARQQTLEGAIAWSYELLEPTERQAFRSLAICAGPFTLGTAARMLLVSQLDAAQVVDTLVAKCLITPIRFDDDSVGYRYLESLREFGRRELTESGAFASARLALETALLPSERLRADWTALANEYVSAGDLSIVIEDATRRDAANHALDDGRIDAAALIFSSCAFRDPGELAATLERVRPLAARRHDLDPLAWRAAVATKLLLERLTRRYEACFMTAIEMLDVLDDDDPARGWFEMWRCALTTAVAPAAGLTEVEKVMAGVRNRAHEPHDWTLSQLLGIQATGLAVLRQLEDARVAAGEALARAGIGREARDQALALVLWITYLIGGESDDTTHEIAARQSQQLGLAELCAAPAALGSGGSVEERAARLVAASRRRPSTDVTTPFLLAFAWLAVEEGDLEHATQLVAATELYDASTEIALVHLLARVRDWTDEAWPSACDAAIAEYLHTDHEALSRQGPSVLNAEIEAWERRLATPNVKAS